MKISTRGRYALRVMIDLGINSNGKYVSLKIIAERQQISKKYLEQIMTMLVKANLIETVRGNTGGFKLIKKPSEYTVYEILNATEGSLAPVDCITNNTCAMKKVCKTHAFWQGLDDVINDYLKNKTLEDLIK